MHTTSAPADAAGIPPAVTSGGAPVEPEALYMRLGELTRTLHEALRGLGYDRQLEEVVSTLPEARSRLSYIARLTGDAAEKVLNAVDHACGDQDALAEAADAIKASLTADPVAAVAGGGVFNFVEQVRGSCARTNAHLTEIMMAQDFHDLTGQVTRKLVDMAQRLEGDLLKLLLEATPPQHRPAVDASLLDGPVVDPTGRDDVVADQQQVDDLLESLGF